MTIRGSYVHKPMEKFSGAFRKFYFLLIFQNIDGFRQNNSQLKAFRIHKTLILKKIVIFFFLTIFTKSIH